MASDDAKSQLRSMLKDINTYQASFTQIVKDAQKNLVHEASGSIVIERPQKLYWHTELPDEVLLVADGQSVSQVDYFVEQITVVDQSDAVQDNPIMLLASDNDADWLNVNVTFSEDAFVVTPINESAITQLKLVFDDNQLSSLESIDTQQQKSVLTFTGRVINQAVPADRFIVENIGGFVLDDQRKR